MDRVVRGIKVIRVVGLIDIRVVGVVRVFTGANVYVAQQ